MAAVVWLAGWIDRSFLTASFSFLLRTSTILCLYGLQSMKENISTLYLFYCFCRNDPRMYTFSLSLSTLLVFFLTIPLARWIDLTRQRQAKYDSRIIIFNIVFLKHSNRWLLSRYFDGETTPTTLRDWRARTVLQQSTFHRLYEYLPWSPSWSTWLPSFSSVLLAHSWPQILANTPSAVSGVYLL